MHTRRVSTALATLMKGNSNAGRCSSETARDSTPAAPLKTLDDVPGPTSWPLIGSALHFLPYIGKFSAATSNSYDLCDVLYKTYGPLVRLDPGGTQHIMLFSFNPTDMEQVLRQENQLPIRMGFESLEYFRKTVKKAEYDGATGLITDHGEPWKSFRSKVNPVMMQPKTIKRYTAAIDQVALDMVQRLKRIRKADNTIGEEFELEMNKWALESVGVVALGGRLGCLEDGLREDSTARRLIQCVRDSFELIEKLDFKPSPWQYFASPTFNKAMKTFDEQMKLSKMYIEKAIEDMKNSDRPTDVEDKSVLEKLLEIDKKIALVMASDMLFAGVDTVSQTMMSTLYHLATSPGAQARLRGEIRSGLLDQRPYLKACLRESMRLSPVVSGNFRRITRATKLGDYLIPEGIDVLLAHEYMSRQESQYRRAGEFLPERWLVEKEDPLHYAHAHPMTTMPFGYGVRLCIGRRIAQLELETFLARVVQHFHVEWRGPPPTIVHKSLNYMMGPYNFVLRDAE